MTKDKNFENVEDGRSYTSRVERVPEGYDVIVAGLEARVVDAGGGSWLVSTPTGCVSARVEVRGSEVLVFVGHERFRFRSLEGRHSNSRRGSTTGRAEVKAPMSGKVIKFLAAVGDRLEAGQAVLLFEAMKMQNEIRSPRAGLLTEIQVEQGQAVVAHERLFIVGAEE